MPDPARRPHEAKRIDQQESDAGNDKREFQIALSDLVVHHVLLSAQLGFPSASGLCSGCPSQPPYLTSARLALLLAHGLRNAHIGAAYSFHLSDGIERQIDRSVRLADRLRVRTRHEAEGLTILEIDVGGVTDHMESFAGPLQRVELVEELLFSQFFLGEAAPGLVMGVNEILHVVLLYTLVVVQIHDITNVY